MSSLGIYFGPKLINIVETQGKKVLKNVQISTSALSAGDFEEKIPDEIKIVALVKDELRRNKIEAKEAYICLAGQDLIIRNFDIPLLPHNELENAVFFESKKYIPFKTEELVYDFQLKPDKANKRNFVIYEAIKKETLDRYFSIASQLNIKAGIIEYSAFSVFRFLKLTGVNCKGVVAVVTADLKEEDEINFLVLDNGFPLFSRDVALSNTAASVEAKGPEGTAIDKLKTEIRLSLDYYNRKFATKKIEKVFFVSSQECALELEAFAKDVGLNGEHVDITKYIGKSVPFSLSFVKGFGSSLLKTIRTDIKINLITAKDRVKPLKEAVPFKSFIAFPTGIRVAPFAIILSGLICLAAFAAGFYQKVPVQQEIQGIVSQRPGTTTVSPDFDYDTLAAKDTEYKNKIAAIDKTIREQLFLTEPLSIIPRIVPAGLWLKNFNFTVRNDGKADLVLDGAAYLGDSEKEFKVINNFVENLRADPVFGKYFSEINITYLRTQQEQDVIVSSFSISCHNYKGRQ